MKRLTLIALCLITCICICYIQLRHVGHISINSINSDHFKLNKKDVELVVAAYGEDLTWLTEFSKFVTIYDKKDRSNITVINAKRVYLPNIGRESQTYLHHIVHNYDNLANITVFLQGTKPGFGYSVLNNKGDGGHFYCPVTIYDYLMAKNGLFIFTEMTPLNNGRHVIRNGYNNYAKRKKNRCIPRSAQNLFEFSPMPDRCFSLDDYESYTDNIVFNVDIAKECNAAQDTASAPYPCSKTSFWKKYIKLPLPPKSFLWYAQGAIFSVTREQIHRRPIQDYKLLLDDFNNSTKSYLGFLMEWFWYPLVTSESVACSETYYDSKTPSIKFQKVLKYLECKECGIFNEDQFKTKPKKIKMIKMAQ